MPEAALITVDTAYASEMGPLLRLIPGEPATVLLCSLAHSRTCGPSCYRQTRIAYYSRYGRRHGTGALDHGGPCRPCLTARAAVALSAWRGTPLHSPPALTLHATSCLAVAPIAGAAILEPRTLAAAELVTGATLPLHEALGHGSALVLGQESDLGAALAAQHASLFPALFQGASTPSSASLPASTQRSSPGQQAL